MRGLGLDATLMVATIALVFDLLMVVGARDRAAEALTSKPYQATIGLAIINIVALVAICAALVGLAVGP